LKQITTLGVGVLISYGVAGLAAVKGADSIMSSLWDTSKGAKGGLTDLGGVMVTIGAGAVTMAAGFKEVEVAMDMISSYADYEEKLLDLQGLFGADTEAMRRFHDEAINLSKSYPYMASEIAEGMWYLASSGFTQNEVMESIGSTMQYATIGHMELSDAAKNLTAVMRAYNIPATESQATLDKLVQTMSMYQLTMSDFGPGFANWALIASEANQPLEEMLVLYGQLTTQGLRPSRAGMMIKMMLTSLMGASEESRALLDSLDVDLYVSENGVERMKTLSEIMFDIRDSLDAGENADFLRSLVGDPNEVLKIEGMMDALVTIFGRRAVAGYMSAVSQDLARDLMDGTTEYLTGREAFVEARTRIEFSEGRGLEYFLTVMKGINKQVDNLKSTWESLKIVLVTSIGPAIGQAISWVNDLIVKVISFFQANPKIAEALFAALSVGGIVSILAGAVTVIVGLIKGIALGAAALGVSTAPLWSFLGILAAVVILIPVLTALIVRYRDELAVFFTWIWDRIRPIVMFVVAILKLVWKIIYGLYYVLFPIIAIIVGVIIGAVMIVIGIILGILSFLRVLWAVIEVIFTLLVALFTWNFDTLGEDIKTIFGDLSTDLFNMEQLASAAIDGLGEAFDKMLMHWRDTFLNLINPSYDASEAAGLDGESVVDPTAIPVPHLPYTGDGLATGSRRVPNDGWNYLHEDEVVSQTDGNFIEDRGSSLTVGQISITIQGSNYTDRDAEVLVQKILTRLSTEMERVV